MVFRRLLFALAWLLFNVFTQFHHQINSKDTLAFADDYFWPMSSFTMIKNYLQKQAENSQHKSFYSAVGGNLKTHIALWTKCLWSFILFFVNATFVLMPTYLNWLIILVVLFKVHQPTFCSLRCSKCTINRSTSP